MGSGPIFTESHAVRVCISGDCSIPGVAFQSWWGKGEQAGFAGGVCVVVPCLLGLPDPTPSPAP